MTSGQELPSAGASISASQLTQTCPECTSVVSGPGSVGAAADTPPVTARRDHCTVRCTVHSVQYSAVQCRTPEHVQCVEGGRRESMCPRTVI